MVYIVLNKIPLFIRALSTVAIGRDAWTTVICTPTALILHTAADDQCCTASGSVPRELFIEYRLGTTMSEVHSRQQQRGAATGGSSALVVAVDADASAGGGRSPDGGGLGGDEEDNANQIGPDAQFMVHVQSFIDALTVAGAQSLASPYLTATVSFPERDGKLLVELSEPANTTASGHARLVQCHLMTRPLRERMLDLRFQDSLTANRLCLRADVAKDLLADIAAFNCEHVRISFPAAPDGAAAAAVGGANAQQQQQQQCAVIEGLKGPYGDMSCVVDRSTDGVIALDVTDPHVVGKYPLTHFAVALSSGKWYGLVGGGSTAPEGGGGGRGGGGRGGGGSGAGGGDASVPDLASFSRVTLNFNRERQLCVMHRTREHDVQVRVDVVITPLSTLFDEDD